MDNNECEQLMRQVGLGRKNWLFAGSIAGGERNAAFLTLASTAHRNDLEVRAYIHDIPSSPDRDTVLVGAYREPRRSAGAFKLPLVPGALGNRRAVAAFTNAFP